MASNPASRRNSISAQWPEIDFSRPSAQPKRRVKEGVKIYDSPSPSPFLAQMGVFDYLFPNQEGISPMPAYSGVLPAIVDGARSMSREELQVMSLRLAGGLRALGLSRGDTAVVQAEGIEGSIALYGLLAAGMVVSPVVPDVELGHHLDDATPRVVFISPSQLSSFEAANKQLSLPIPDDRVVLLSPPSATFDLTPQRYRTLYDVLVSEESTAEQFNGAASMSPALRLYTPNGRAVTLSHLNVCSQLSAAQLELGPSDVALIAPGAPFIASLIPLALGAAVTHSTSILSALESSEATLAFLPPPAIANLLQKLKARDGEANELSLRTVISTGAPLHAIGRRLERVLPSLRTIRDATVGLLAPFIQARLLSSDGSDAPLGSKGELLLRGPSVSTTGHWFRTGDIASVRHGRWTIHGKIQNRFTVNDTSICPERLEALLLKHPRVRDAAVSGSAEGVRAYLVMDAEGEAMVQHVMRYVQGRTRKQKWIRGVVITEAIPRTSAGLVKRGQVRGGEVVKYEPGKWARM